MASSATHSEINSPRPRRFLYAEDMPELRDLLEIILRGEGHALTCAPDGSKALDLVTRNPSGFDIVITDHHMPVMNGLEFVTRLRAQAFPGKIIVFSSELSPEIDLSYRRLQVDAILAKPIFPAVLRSTLTSL